MVHPICPVCGEALLCERPAWHCPRGHSYDVARQGYVNLLTVQQKHSLHPGDTREMVLARRDFLDQGYYLPIVDKLRGLLCHFAPEADSVLDVGCGEGYYLSQLPMKQRWGIDISKEAVRFAAVRDKNAHFLTATAAHLPFSAETFPVLLSMFALTVPGEFSRVLTRDGIFLQVLAGESHLRNLKRIIYPALLEKPKELHPDYPEFSLLHKETLSFDFKLESGQMVQNLLSMTPHFWRISREGALALANTAHLEDTAQVIFNVYGRQGRENLIK